MDTVSKLTNALNSLVKRVDAAYTNVDNRTDILVQLSKEVGTLSRIIQNYDNEETPNVGLDMHGTQIGLPKVVRDIVIAGLKLAALERVDLGGTIQRWFDSKNP